ncbi:Levanase precursor [Aquisphaera giovannonii]|uniref:Levanase n=1 Tax=Aquisphaera giovannonii TaxID=406548 RepID=A0A5B9WCD3_9BACT|nr:glycoside hydrolase family 32 protein [Aquisphaera giovannonii]QEH38276.1 Levanase precursor [Aquisphaera giovannonii]
MHLVATHPVRGRVSTALSLLAIAIGPANLAAAEEPGPVRPLYHFTAERNFINDPNGLVVADGEYHLFYQHNPEGDRWGHMSWGHAVSRDLVRWQHLPIALRESGGIMAFSGSAVLDSTNTSGFGRGAMPPMVAIFTGDGLGKQTQNLAYSTDRGRTWTMYAKNPVLDIGSKEFRDPKVFYHHGTGRWIMATVLADQHKVRLWGSKDLKSWEKLSDFGPAGATGGVWECPELFSARVERATRMWQWVLKVDVNPGAPNGGSGGQYFVGEFDGKEFRPERKPDAPPLWIDGGKDFYAAQAWNDAPGEDPTWIGWMNNWQYANDIPTSPWRGAMTAPRRVRLRRTRDGHRLVQLPAESLRSLRGREMKLGPRPIPPGDIPLGGEGVEGTALEVAAAFRPGDCATVGLKVRTGEGEETVIGFDRKSGELFVDRTRSGKVAFSRDFPGRHAAKLPAGAADDVLFVYALIDATSVEVFADGGAVAMTDQIFPRPDSRGVSLFATGGTARLESLSAWPLRP